jgi:hypothetical protein
MKTGGFPSVKGAWRMVTWACEGGETLELGGVGAPGGIGAGEPRLLGTMVAGKILGDAVEVSCLRHNVFCMWYPRTV